MTFSSLSPSLLHKLPIKGWWGLGGGDFPRLLWMWPIATFILGKQNQNTTKRNPQLFDSLPTRCIYLATYFLSGMIPCYDALVNFPKSKRFFIWMKSNNLALKSWSALPHTCSITMHITLFFLFSDQSMLYLLSCCVV